MCRLWITSGGEALGGGCDAFVGRREGHTHVLGAGRAVERTGSSQDPALGEPLDGGPAFLAAGGPEVEPGLGMPQGEAGTEQRFAKDRSASGVALSLDQHMLLVAEGRDHGRL